MVVYWKDDCSECVRWVREKLKIRKIKEQKFENIISNFQPNQTLFVACTNQKQTKPLVSGQSLECFDCPLSSMEQ